MLTRTNYVIIGAGGFAQEVYNCLLQRLEADQTRDFTIDFVVDDLYFSETLIFGKTPQRLSEYDFTDKSILIGIADVQVRSRIARQLDAFHFGTLIHPSASIGLNVSIGEGSIICQNVVLTCNISLGAHTHLNLNTTVGHDSTIGNFFTSAPSVNISGSCTIGSHVYLGTQVAVREKITITDQVTVGMGGIILKNISEAGVYIGFPVKKVTP